MLLNLVYLTSVYAMLGVIVCACIAYALSWWQRMKLRAAALDRLALALEQYAKPDCPETRLLLALLEEIRTGDSWPFRRR